MTTTIMIRKINNGYIVQHHAGTLHRPENETFFATEEDLLEGMKEVTFSSLRIAEIEIAHAGETYGLIGGGSLGGQIDSQDLVRSQLRRMAEDENRQASNRSY